MLALQVLPAASVLTQHNNPARTGANTNEIILNTSNVNAAQFGLLFKRNVDGQIYAQPLYVPSLAIPNQGTHNVVYVATMHNTVYTFDADDATQTTPLWGVNLGPSVPISYYTKPYGVQNIQVEVGILSTPVIDLASKTIYVVSWTYPNKVIGFSLHALSLTTGAEQFNGPVAISATVPGMGQQSINGMVPFTAADEWQRAGLLLSKGNLFLAFASHGDNGDRHGWVLDIALRPWGKPSPTALRPTAGALACGNPEQASPETQRATPISSLAMATSLPTLEASTTATASSS